MSIIDVMILEKVSLELIMRPKISNIKTITKYFENGSPSGGSPEEDPWSKYIAIVLICDIFGRIMSSKSTFSKIINHPVFPGDRAALLIGQNNTDVTLKCRQSPPIV